MQFLKKTIKFQADGLKFETGNNIGVKKGEFVGEVGKLFIPLGFRTMSQATFYILIIRAYFQCNFEISNCTIVIF